MQAKVNGGSSAKEILVSGDLTSFNQIFPPSSSWKNVTDWFRQWKATQHALK